MLLELHGWLPDLIEAHLETLEVLWPTWASARGSAEYAWDELARLEARIEANLDALVLAEDEGDAVIDAGLGSDAPGAVLAAALVRARLGRSGEVIARMEAAAPAAALAMGEALGVFDGPIDPLPASDSPAVVVALARALSLRGRAIAQPERVLAVASDPAADPSLRSAAWRVAGDLIARGAAPAPGNTAWIAALGDEAVGEDAAFAAAWSRQPWLLPHLRARASKDPLALRWLAILGGSSDRALVITALKAGGSAHHAAALGHVEVADALLELTASTDPARAVAAGEAFWRITDHRRVLDATVTLGDPDDDLADTAHPPDPAALRRFWGSARGAFAGGERWSRAVDVDRAELDRLDAQARRERVLREVHHGQRRPELAIVDRYPLYGIVRRPLSNS